MIAAMSESVSDVNCAAYIEYAAIHMNCVACIESGAIHS